jgi:ATP-dependent DNA ligase
MAGRPFVVEAKWDGIRIQCHVEPGRVQYISRRGVEHGDHSDYSVMDAAVRAQVGGGAMACSCACGHWFGV